MDRKVCIKCRIEKSVEEFSKHKRRKDGLKSWCKDCCKEYDIIKRHGSLEQYQKVLDEREQKQIAKLNNRKTCPKCKIEKSIEEFGKHKSTKDGLRSWCKECEKEYWSLHQKKIYIIQQHGSLENYQKKLDEKEKKEIAILNNRKTCSTCKIEKDLCCFGKNNTTKDGFHYKCKDCMKAFKKEHYQNHKEEISKKSKIYRENNKEVISKRTKKYRDTHKKEANEWRKKRYNKDPKFKLDNWMSSSVNHDLRKRGTSKQGKSCWNYVDYTKEELVKHIESQFEPWMNWENHGKAILERRTWQIDHILPRSSFTYNHPTDPEFKKCWALENLRPLEAIENIRKGNKILKNK